ncbi:MAG: molybdopterin molybdotransferase MoeA [Clostridiales bacterium]|nr:molybdopterin molybdotransferase MoeA [Clostridiales bacterium]
MRKHIELDDAIRMIQTLDASPKTETIPLASAQGRILAEDIEAAFPMPPFNKSPFDGFALHSKDLPGTLPVTAVVAAGEPVVDLLCPGTAVRIFTGAPIPEGADVVVKQEDTFYNSQFVTVSRAFAPQSNIIITGEDYEAGAILACRGETISPAIMGVLASQGLAQIPVFQKPKAVILSTGSELSQPGTERMPYGIYNSSYYLLRGYLEKMGFVVSPDTILPDDLDTISASVRTQMDSDADLVITTGGASVGDFDFAVSTAKKIGADILFWKVNMKPGGALLVSRRNSKVLLGLSGNPAAALMSILVVLQSYLRKLTGSRSGNQEIRLPISQDMRKTSSASRLLRGHAVALDGKLYFEENQGQRNGSIASFHNCSMIAVTPGNSPPVSAGDMVRAIQLPKDLT